MALKPRLIIAGAAIALLTVIGVWALPRPDAEQDKPAIGLFTTLPIYWGESASVAEALEQNAEQHWARTTLEADASLTPLDTLAPAELGRLKRLIIAQPRPLAPAENVALDDWVRAGGRLLLFADPMLTEHSRFQIGDRRRPQDVVVLSPILRRWGLELLFDDQQPDVDRSVTLGNGSFPARLAGSLRAVPAGAAAQCSIESESVVARCRIGRGSAVVVADAAVLERERNADDPLQLLTGVAFAD